jgi:hypothetical protein
MPSVRNKPGAPEIDRPTPPETDDPAGPIIDKPVSDKVPEDTGSRQRRYEDINKDRRGKFQNPSGPEIESIERG